jgi:hypothetical protein
MTQTSAASVGKLDPAQAAELSLLVDLEACWENLRQPTPRDADVGIATKDLSAKQKAYDLFRTRLVAYNKRYTPAHAPELLLNTPSRLGTWCRAMRDLYLQAGHNPKGHCPVHVLEKAYRRADQIGVRMNKGLVSRTPPPAAIGDAIRELEALARWCADLIRAAHPGPQPVFLLPAPHQSSQGS